MKKKGQLGGLAIGITTLIIAGVVLVMGIIVINETSEGYLESESTTFLADYDSPQTVSSLVPDTLTSATAKNQTWLDFDGVNDKINWSKTYQQFNFTGSSPYDKTFLIWAKLIDNSTENVMFSKYESGTRGFIFRNSANTNTLELVFYNTSGSADSINSANVINESSWKMYAFSVNSSGYVQLYGNGRFITSGQIDNDFDGGTGAYFKIGDRNDGFFNGSIDDVLILDTYISPRQIQSLYLENKHSDGFLGQGIPIIYYHYIDEDAGHTSTAVFQTHMDYLYDNGFETVSMQNIYDWKNGNYTMPNKPINIQFDDNEISVYTNATPIMDIYGFTGTMVVPSNWIGGGYLSWAQLSELVGKGWEIGSHGVDSLILPSLNVSIASNLTALIKELNQSRWDIYNNISIMPNYYVYPTNNYTENTSYYCDDYYDMCSGIHGLGSGEFYQRRMVYACLLYTSPSPRDGLLSRMPSSA